MAFGKSSRMDSRRPSSSSYCSMVTLVVFVALCLVGVWMMTSSTMAPVDVSAIQSKSDGKEQVSHNDRPFDDGSGDGTEEATKGNGYTSSGTSPEETTTSDATQDQTEPEKQEQTEPEKEEQTEPEKQDQTEGEKINEVKEQETLEDSPSKENEDKKDDSDGASKGQIYSDENGKVEGGEPNKDDGGAKTDGTKGDGQENSMEENPGRGGNMDDKSSEQTEDTSNEKIQNETETKTEGSVNERVQDEGETKQDETVQDQVEQKFATTGVIENEQISSENKTKEQSSTEMFPDPAQSELLNETHTQTGSWSTQATESKKEKEKQKPSNGQIVENSWKLCSSSAGPDYIPCLDNEEAIRKLPSTKHYEHRERHCPEDGPTCLVPLPEGYKQPITWPNSRDKIWYANVPHTKLAVVKGHQNWVKATGEYLTFPGGGTQFKHGALHYIDFIQESLPDIAWGKRSRVILDVGCGVASLGGFLFERDTLTMSFAPKDEHEAQVQFALERGIPAISAVMGTKRLPFPGTVFDIVHCARCRVPWHIEGGKLLLELNRLLRPGGYFVWSATPVYQKLPEDVEIWKAMSELTKSMCWEMVTMTKDTLNGVGVAIYRKPTSNECYDTRVENEPPICKGSDDPNAAWSVPLQACMHRIPVDPSVRGSQWPEQWPKRLETAPYWMNSSQLGVYGQPAPEDFRADYEHWKRVVNKSYLSGMGINWSNVRNVMDMRAVYGGFGAALRDMKVWVMNVVTIDSADTLPIIYERGLFGMYHDWCQSFSTYPRTYDLLHADHLFSKTKKRCKLLAIMAEVDRMLRPEGKLILRDDIETISEVENIARSLQWEIRMTYSKEKEGLLCVQKSLWRPQEVETSM